MGKRSMNLVGEKSIWVLTTVLFASFVIFDKNVWISIILVAITSFILLIDSIHGQGRVKLYIGIYQILILIFCLFCYASAIWAWIPSLAIEKGTTVLKILICTTVVYSHYSKLNDISPLINAVMWAGYITVVYAILFYGVDTIIKIATEGERLLNGFTNINTLGMMSAITLIIAFYNILFVDRKLSWSNFLVLPTIVMTGISGSRKSIVIIVVGMILLLMKRYSSRSILNSLLEFGLIAVILFFTFRFLMTLSIFESVNYRMKGLVALITGEGNIDSSMLLRQRYIQLGLDQFKRTPILGIGMNNASVLVNTYTDRDTYLHNNFVELLADGGIVGFICYYLSHVYLIVEFFKHRKSTDPGLVICSLLLFVLLIMDFGSVTYYSKSNYFYLMILFLEVNILNLPSK